MQRRVRGDFLQTFRIFVDFQSVKEVELPREDTEQQDAKYDPDGASAGSPANR